MNKLLITLGLSVLSATPSFAGWFGPGPWANASYYPGNIDGQYQAAVYGNNIAGVLGFALQNGSPTTSTNSTLTTSNNSTQSQVVVDPFQNYFAIFVEGRTYTGYTTAAANYNNSTVTGALIGTQPDFDLIDKTITSFSTNQEVTTVQSSDRVDNIIYITNVVTTYDDIGTSNVVTTNYTVLTNTVTTNNITVVEDPIAGIIYQTNTYVTNIVTTSPTITTNIINLYRTNFTTNITSQTVASNSRTYITNPVVSTLDNTYTTFDPTVLLNRGLNGGFTARVTAKQSIFTFQGDGELSTPAQFQTVNFTTNAQGDVVGAQIQTDTVPFQLDGIRVSFLAGSTPSGN